METACLNWFITSDCPQPLATHLSTWPYLVNLPIGCVLAMFITLSNKQTSEIHVFLTKVHGTMQDCKTQHLHTVCHCAPTLAIVCHYKANHWYLQCICEKWEKQDSSQCISQDGDNLLLSSTTRIQVFLFSPCNPFEVFLAYFFSFPFSRHLVTLQRSLQANN